MSWNFVFLTNILILFFCSIFEQMFSQLSNKSINFDFDQQQQVQIKIPIDKIQQPLRDRAL